MMIFWVYSMEAMFQHFWGMKEVQVAAETA
jgi:hypothetical protein